MRYLIITSLVITTAATAYDIYTKRRINKKLDLV